MITRIEAKGFRCFQSVGQDLGKFQVLVGPNGSGKSVFLDVLAFLSAFVSDGLQEAVQARTENFHDLVWGREGSCFELTVDARSPQRQDVRYELGVRLDPGTETLIPSEREIISPTATTPQVLLERPLRSQGPWSEDLQPWQNQTFLWLQNLIQNKVQVVSLDSKSLRKPSPPGQGKQQVIDGSINFSASAGANQIQLVDRSR